MNGSGIKRDFLSIYDLSRDEIFALLDLSARMKSGEWSQRPLVGKTLAMIFTKSSTRTRTSFEVGTVHLGGHALFLSSRDIQLARGEPVRDTARVLSRYVDGIMIRTYSHLEVEELAAFSTVPVINGLTDLLHPCQILADLLTIRESIDRPLDELTIAWIGDGNNVANSWINAAARLGFALRIATPPGYTPDETILERARAVANITLTQDPHEAAEGADVINTDVWASMGQEGEAEDRAAIFRDFQIDASLMSTAADDSIFLHCLPAHRGEEVTEDVLEGPRSRVFDQAENRLHVQKAIMVRLMAPESDQ